MAGIGMMIGGAVVNALAFTGGNALFSVFDKKGALEESQRHNAAIEKLNKETANYNIKREKNIDWLNTEIARKQEATNEIYSVNNAFDTYKKLFGNIPEESLPHPNLQYPEFDYHPSEEQKKYETIFTTAGSIASVVGAASLIK